MKLRTYLVTLEVVIDTSEFPEYTPSDAATYVAGALMKGFAAEGESDVCENVTAYEVVSK